jgi:predicted dehydrogenase
VTQEAYSKGLLAVKSRKLRIGLIGTGNIARAAHLPAWKKNPDVEIVAVADIRPERARAMAEANGVPNVFDDHRKLLAMKEIDAVDICTPNIPHTPVVLDCLAAGKHVLCEKPLAARPKEIETMMRAARKARRILTVVQNNRFRGVSQAIKRWVDAGNLGKPYYARAWAIRRNLLPPASTFTDSRESGGGACLDIGVHCLDLIMWLMGFPEPVSVTGTTSNHLAKTVKMPGHWGQWDPKKIDVEDFACGLVRFANGAMLSLETSWLGHIPQPELLCGTVLGDKGGVSWPSGEASSTVNGALVDSVIKPLPALESSHESLIFAYYESIVDGKPLPVEPAETLKVIRILDGVYRSRTAGREVKV